MPPLFRILVVPAVAACALVIATAASADANPSTFESTTPISTTFFNPCNGESIPMTGTMHEVVHTTNNENTTDFVGNLEFHLSGFGETTGTQYVANHVSNFDFSINSEGQFELTLVNHAVLVAQGPEPNSTVTQFAHLTFNANGEITSNQFSFETSCQG